MVGASWEGRILHGKELAALYRDAATEEGEIGWIFRRLTGRRPDKVEMQILIDLLKEQRKSFAAEPDRAEKLVSVGASKRDKSLDVKELAAMTAVAQAVMNSDAVVWKR